MVAFIFVFRGEFTSLVQRNNHRLNRCFESVHGTTFQKIMVLYVIIDYVNSYFKWKISRSGVTGGLFIKYGFSADASTFCKGF